MIRLNVCKSLSAKWNFDQILNHGDLALACGSVLSSIWLRILFWVSKGLGLKGSGPGFQGYCDA